MRLSRVIPLLIGAIFGILAVQLSMAADHTGSASSPVTEVDLPTSDLYWRDLTRGIAVPAVIDIPQYVPAPDISGQVGPLGQSCDTKMTAVAGAGATVTVHIEAPCAPSSRIRIRHGEIFADYKTTNSGVLETVLPAFSQVATYEAHLPNGTTLTASAEVAEASDYERVVTLWTGKTGLSVHAFEYGASEGEIGHVWKGAARAPEISDFGRGGFHLTLGTSDWHDSAMAEVYSFPVSNAARSGSVRIELGAEVTEQNCGTSLNATSIQIGDGLPGAPVDLILTLPECGSGDGTILLKNLARDLKIAAE